MNKLVSVITPSYGRARLLVEAIKNVRAQTYRPIEHIIVTDGIPEVGWQGEIGAAVAPYRTLPNEKRPDYSVRVVPLGRHWSCELDDSYAAAPMAVGQLLAAGDYQCWLADDERMTPEHVSKLVALLEEKDADFVYPFVAYYKNGDDKPTVIGSDPPRKSAVTHTLYKRELINLGKGPYRTHEGRASDWEQVERWIKAGAVWEMLNEVTFSHRDDAGFENTKHWNDDLPAWANP